MVTKFYKLLLIIAMLAMQSGCLKFSDDSGNSVNSSAPTSSSGKASDNVGEYGGVINLTPSLKYDSSGLPDIDYDTLTIKSTTPGGGSSTYSRSLLGDSGIAELPISHDHSYVLILKKGSTIVYQERLR